MDQMRRFAVLAGVGLLVLAGCGTSGGDDVMNESPSAGVTQMDSLVQGSAVDTSVPLDAGSSGENPSAAGGQDSLGQPR